MIKIYDKAQWHIDAGENKNKVIEKFKSVFIFLDSKTMLTHEGKEIIDLGIDSSISINERMLTDIGNKFMEKNYDDIINMNETEIFVALEEKYKQFR